MIYFISIVFSIKFYNIFKHHLDYYDSNEFDTTRNIHTMGRLPYPQAGVFLDALFGETRSDAPIMEIDLTSSNSFRTYSDKIYVNPFALYNFIVHSFDSSYQNILPQLKRKTINPNLLDFFKTEIVNRKSTAFRYTQQKNLPLYLTVVKTKENRLYLTEHLMETDSFKVSNRLKGHVNAFFFLDQLTDLYEKKIQNFDKTNLLKKKNNRIASSSYKPFFLNTLKKKEIATDTNNNFKTFLSINKSFKRNFDDLLLLIGKTFKTFNENFFMGELDINPSPSNSMIFELIFGEQTIHKKLENRKLPQNTIIGKRLVAKKPVETLFTNKLKEIKEFTKFHKHFNKYTKFYDTDFKKFDFFFDDNLIMHNDIFNNIKKKLKINYSSVRLFNQYKKKLPHKVELLKTFNKINMDLNKNIPDKRVPQYSRFKIERQHSNEFNQNYHTRRIHNMYFKDKYFLSLFDKVRFYQLTPKCSIGYTLSSLAKKVESIQNYDYLTYSTNMALNTLSNKKPDFFFFRYTSNFNLKENPFYISYITNDHIFS